MRTTRRKPILTPIGPEALTSVSEVVVRALREAILNGSFRPGDRLLQNELAVHLRVSRQPVREALRRLQSEGLVVQSPQRGVLVREFTEEDVRENYHLRELLESEAARLAADRIQVDELQVLKSLNQAISEAISRGNKSRLVELNLHFHRRVREATRMPTLVRLIDQLWVGRTIFTPLFVEGRARRSVEEHAALVTALEAHSPENAAAAMRQHIQRAAMEFLSERAKAQLGTRRDGAWDTS